MNANERQWNAHASACRASGVGCRASQGRIEAICISERKGERKSAVPSAQLRVNHGIEGDAHAGPWHRQVSLLAADDVASMRGKGLPALKPGDFAENIVVSGLALDELGLGSHIRLGREAELRITQIGKVCHARCAIYHQTGDCIMPRRGVFARVTHGGGTNVGDEVSTVKIVRREMFQCVVLTVSDRCSRLDADDTAGPAVAERLRTGLAARRLKRPRMPCCRAPCREFAAAR